MSYRTSITFTSENRRFLHRIQREAEEMGGRRPHISTIVDEIVTQVREEVDEREPRVSATGHGELPVQERPDWVLAAAEIILRR